MRRTHGRKYFYKYTTASAAKSILANRTLRLSSPLTFNDPFDVARSLKLPMDSAVFSRNVVDELARLMRQGAVTPSPNNPKLRQLLEYTSTLAQSDRERLASNLSPADLPDVKTVPSFQEMQEIWKWFLPRIRILCLTEEYDNTVMWSSYADAYKGVAIELECIDMYDSILLLAQPVIYSDVPPVLGTPELWIQMMTGQVPFDYKALFEELEYVKSTRWQYEKEWRVISFEKNSSGLYSNYGMHVQTFTKVYLGKDISGLDREDVLRLASHELSHMEVHEMRVNHDESRLTFVRSSSAT